MLVNIYNIVFTFLIILSLGYKLDYISIFGLRLFITLEVYNIIYILDIAVLFERS